MTYNVVISASNSLILLFFSSARRTTNMLSGKSLGGWGEPQLPISRTEECAKKGGAKMRKRSESTVHDRGKMKLHISPRPVTSLKRGRAKLIIID